jgi:hypothetical protein
LGHTVMYREPHLSPLFHFLDQDSNSRFLLSCQSRWSNNHCVLEIKRDERSECAEQQCAAWKSESSSHLFLSDQKHFSDFETSPIAA